VKVHPLAEKLPLMDAQRFKELCTSIADHGLSVPIVRLDEQILDGRNRQRACDKTGKPAHYVEFKDLRLRCTPEQYIFDQAVNRRDLTDDQRAAFILEAKPYLAQQAAERMKAAGQTQADRGKEGGRGKKKPPMAKSPEGVSEAESIGSHNLPEGYSQEANEKLGAADRTVRRQLAQQAGVSEYKVSQAEAVERDAPELLPDVIAGKLPLREAAKKAKAKTAAKKPRAIKPLDPDREALRIFERILKSHRSFDADGQKLFREKLQWRLTAIWKQQE